MSEQNNLGETGQFPDGKISPEDDGELRLGVAHDQDNVHINFGKSVEWVAMDRATAVNFASLILKHAAQLRE